MYPGLFAYLNSEIAKPSRFRAGLMSLGFSFGVVTVVGAFGLAFMLLRIELDSLTGNGTLAILHNVPGIALLTIIGLTYLTGRSFRIPVPTIGAPNALIHLRGYRAAPIWGMFTGGPGATHCTVALVIPIVFLSLSARDPTAIAYNFGFYALGRAIPIVAIGLMLHDVQVRFLRVLNEHSRFLNRIIGVTILASGIGLFFVG
jgi:cytochrome c biogenesis protein CcdA